MPRAVIVKKSLLDSPTVRPISMLGALMLHRFWLVSDSFGCFENSPRKLLGDIFPDDTVEWQQGITPDNISAWLDEYAEAGLLETWEENGRRYAFWLSWWKTNRHRKDYARTTPVPPSQKGTEYDTQIDREPRSSAKSKRPPIRRHLADNPPTHGGQPAAKPPTQAQTEAAHDVTLMADKPPTTRSQTADNPQPNRRSPSYLLPLTYNLLPSPSNSEVTGEGEGDFSKGNPERKEVEIKLTDLSNTRYMQALVTNIVQGITGEPWTVTIPALDSLYELRTAGNTWEVILKVFVYYVETREDASTIRLDYFAKIWNRLYASYERSKGK